MIPAPVGERLAIATAEYNNCTYCFSAHTYIGARVAKVGAGGLECARHAESADPHAAAVPDPSHAIARGHIGETQLEAAWAVGVTDAEVAGNLALNILANYFNVLADTDIEWPVVTPHTDA
ncbi:hypothetical protein [Streptomyces carpinensis]|uniref:Carboxymuconolactone decarboxylase-like domain-containing protein n=1 Tax=Streptomyces carpinensis TaxID=66369 RepID=A0ABV1W3M5_9ACTN|nr:hypothetical protein [Streptomyces carpinensis]